MVIAADSDSRASHPFYGSPEHRLIFACARCDPSSTVIHQILDEYPTTLDWSDVVQTACWHGVLPLVYWSLSRLAAPRIPKEVLSQLMRLYLLNSVHNQRLTSALLQLSDLFKAKQIPVIFFKGPVLAETVYGSIHLRRFSDIDLLVHEADVPKVRQILMEQQYLPKDLLLPAQLKDSMPTPPVEVILPQPETYEALALTKASFGQSGETMFIHRKTWVTLDLHWQLMPNYFPVAFDLDQMWQRGQVFSLNGSTVFSLSPQDLLLYLCVHGSKELWRHLIWVCDVAEVVRVYPNLPWLDLQNQAKALGVERMFLLGLALAHDCLEMPIPVALEAPIRDHAIVKELRHEFKHRLLTKTETLIAKRDTGFWLFHNPIHLRLRDRLRDRLPQYWLTLLFAITPNEEDQHFLFLPKVLFPLHYLVRPVRIFYKWIVLRRQAFGRH